MSEVEQYTPIKGEIVSRRDMRNATTDSWTDVLEDVGDLAQRIAGTDFVPDAFKGSVPAVAATILHGREIGFAPMTALASLHSIKGKVGLSAEAMRALVMQAGHAIEIVESTTARCVIRGRRAGSESWTQIAWSTDDAKKAQLLSGSGWNKYPRQMLQARASSELCRLLFPDVIRGLASVEELEQYDVISPAGEVAPSGEKKPVRRAARKKPEPAESAPPPLPEDEADPKTAAESETGTPGAGEAPDAPADSAAPTLASAASIRAARKLFDDLGYDTATRVAMSNEVAGREVAKLGELTSGEVNTLIGLLEDRVNEQNTSDESAPPLPEDEPPASDEDIVEAEVIEDENEAEPRITSMQRPKLMVLFGKVDIADRAERLSVLSDLTGRPIESSSDLSKSEAITVIDALEQCESRDDVEAVVQATVAHREGRS